MKKDLKSMYSKFKKVKGMADGGEAEDSSYSLQDLADAFKKAFSAPKPPPSPGPSNEEKYQKIREQNQKNMQDPKNNPSENYYDPNMASGGIVGLQRVTQYADGGEVPHDKKNLLELKKAFDKFISEEGKQKMAMGGLSASPAKNYDDGGQVNPSPSPSPKPTSMGNLFDIPGEDKAADLVKQMPHYDGSEGSYVEPSDAPAKEMDLRQNVANSFTQGSNSATKNTESTPASSGDQPSIREFLGFANGGMAAPNNGKLPYNIANDPEQLQKRDMALNMPHYDGSQGSLVEPNKFIDTQTPQEEAAAAQNVDNTGYAPEDYAAQQAADESTQGQIQDELEASGEKSTEDADELNNSPDEVDRETSSDEDDATQEDDEGNVEIDGDKEKANQDAALAALIQAQNPQNQLAEAQKQRDQAIAEQEAAKGGALIGAGIAGRSGARVDPSQILNVVSAGDKYVNLPVQKYEEQLANQQNDPNSPASQAMKQYMASKGFQIPQNASYADMIKIAPFMAKDAGLQSAMQRALLAAQTKLATNQNSVNAANERNDKNLAAKKDFNNILRQQKQTDAQNKSMVDVENAIQRAKSRGSTTKAYLAVAAADRAMELIKQYPDLDSMPPQQVALLNNELATMAKGGSASPSDSDRKEVSSPTLASRWAGVSQGIQNVPVGAGQGAFIQNNLKYIQGLRDVAQKVIADSVTPVIDSYKNKLSPENFQNVTLEHAAYYRPVSMDDKKAVQHYETMPEGPDKEQLKSILDSKGLL